MVEAGLSTFGDLWQLWHFWQLIVVKHTMNP